MPHQSSDARRAYLREYYQRPEALEARRAASRRWKATHRRQVRAYMTRYNRAAWARTVRLAAQERADRTRQAWWEAPVE